MLFRGFGVTRTIRMVSTYQRMSTSGVEAVPDSINFPKTEEEIGKLWKDIDAFQTSLKQSKGKPLYTFYDGPPFATGKPHYGHLLAGTIKDTVTRYWHQNGYHVERRFGWDTHGLPVEHEIDKEYGIKGPEDVAKIGIAEYNRLCRSIVMRHSGAWRDTVDRIGRWIDFDNDYKTLYPEFMESVWWVFKQLYSKGLVYHGQKVMPFSTACNTPLSNFEAGQNYKDVQDPAITVSFPLIDEPNVSLVAWTTTPWTLPSNLALCVHPDMDYVKVEDVKNNSRQLILMEARLSELFKKETDYKVLAKFKGVALKGKKYAPLFDYFDDDFGNDDPTKGAWRVCCDGYVTADSGTGVVHQAPYFGADDFRVCLDNGIITKDGITACPVDSAGKFTAKVADFAQRHVKEADKDIIARLKADGRLVKQATVNHSYPFCWRSGTPLIYKAVPSWFVRVEHAREAMLKSNDETYWVPDYVKDKRFGNWLKNANDWCISRNRYWGTPIPLWVSDDLEEVVCVGSIKELAKLTGAQVTDIHRESIDHLTIPSKTGRGELKRVSEVFDCWFESGSMPYAQNHYPFENKKKFEDSFPANFIAEGIDQTRGWFYTLIVLSTHLFGRPPFKNVIVNGLVLAKDGQKMSKSKKNYPDPNLLFDKYGADAVRLYLISSVAVSGGDLRFKEEEVKDIIKDVFLPWYNAYRFLIQNIRRHQIDTNTTFVFNEELVGQSTNIMDQWILSYCQSLISSVRNEMETYHLNRVIPKLLKFIEQLTNWYVRFNRKRLKGETGAEDCVHALTTLYSVIDAGNRLMSPACPFITEHLYQNLKRLRAPHALDGSIHYQMLPEVNESLINVGIEEAVANMTSVIRLGRTIRDQKDLPEKYPLPEVVVIRPEQASLDQVTVLEHYIQEQLNVRKVTFTTDKKAYGVELRAEPQIPVLGKRLGKEAKNVFKLIREMSDVEIEQLQQTGTAQLGAHTITSDEVRIRYNAESKGDQEYEAGSEGSLLVLLNMSLTQDMKDEGVAREFIARCQKLKKAAKLVPTDEVTIFFNLQPGYLRTVVETRLADIATAVRATVKCGVAPDAEEPIAEADEDMKGKFNKAEKLHLSVCYGTIDKGAARAPLVKHQVIQTGSGDTATILLENPRGRSLGLTVDEAARMLYGDGVNVNAKGATEPEFVNLKFIGADRYGVNCGLTTGTTKSKAKYFATVVTNNPGYEINDIDGVKAAGAKLFGWDGTDCDKVELYYDLAMTHPVVALDKCLNGTVFFTNVTQKIN